MPDADFFTALGFFTRRGFLDSDTCARLRAEVGAAPASAATVRTEDRAYDVDRSTRSTEWAEVAPEAVELVEGRLAAVMPEVSRHYGIPLTGLQPLQFLVYRQGDFFQRHRDRGEGDDTPAFSRARRVAAIIFLNGEGDPSASAGYRGGALTLYGLFEQSKAETLGFPLEAEEGLLVTFPADVMHEVRPVEAGERYTVVTWFEDGSEDVAALSYAARSQDALLEVVEQVGHCVQARAEGDPEHGDFRDELEKLRRHSSHGR